MHWREKLRRIPIGIVLLFVVLGAGLGVAGRVYCQGEERQFKRSVGNELLTIAEMKVVQIQRWRRERVHDAEKLRRGPFVRTSADAVLRGEAPAGLPRETAEFLEVFREYHGNERIVGIDRRGAQRLALRGGASKHDAQCAAAAAEALSTGTVVVSDLHRAGSDSGAHLCAATPIAPTGGRGPAAGAVVLRISAERFLYRLIKSWPTASPTGETLLVRREGDEVVYLNQLRHRQGTALKLRLPLGTEGLIEAMAVKGRAGLLEGRDYRGLAVLAAVMPVAGTPWYLVAKVDLEEVHAPLRSWAWWLTVVVGLLLAAAGATMAFLWRNQRAGFYRAQYEAEQQHRAVLDTALDGFAMLSTEGHFVEVNDACCELMGYSRGELLAMRVQDIEVQFTAEEIRDRMVRIRESGGQRFESRVRRKDGRVIAVEISITSLPQDGGRLVVFVRDITERKGAEERVRILAELADTTPASILVHDFDGNMLFANQRTLEYHGYSMDEFMRLNLRELDVPESAALIAPRMRLLAEQGETSFEVAHFRKDGSVIPLMANVRVTRWGDQDVILSIATDLTERKREEEALRASEGKYRTLFETMAQGVVYQDADGRITSANPAAERILGLTLDQMQGRTSVDPRWRAIHEDGTEFPGETHPSMVALRTAEEVRNVVMGVFHPLREEHVWINIHAVAQFKPGERVPYQVYTTFEDITERKRAEETARAERDLGLALSETSSLQQALKHCLASAMTISGMDSGGVYMVNDDGSLDLLLHQGLSETLVQAASHYGAESSNARLVHAGAPVYVPSASAELSGAVLLKADGVTAVAILPIRDRGKTVACVNLASHTREDIPQTVRTALERIASRIGPAIIRARAEEALRESQEALARSREQLRALAASLLNAQEEERRRVSRELHDDLNQRLAVLAMQADSLTARLPLPVGELRRELKSLENQVAGLSDDVRRMASQLHPSVLEHLGLAAALRSHCTQFSSREGLPIEFEERGVPAKVSPEVALCLYRIAQEALHNLARHARATRGSVTLAGNEAGIELSITDDGVGFDPQAGRSGGGLGLLSMEERARLAGGTLAIRSSPGRGTRIEARVPAV